MRKRIFRISVNLDTLSHSYRLSLTNEQKAQWVDGFFYGAIGGVPQDGLPASFVAGIEAGRTPYLEALSHQEKSAAGGKRSLALHPENNIRTRMESTADPPPKAPTDTPLEQSSNRVIDISSNPEIEESSKQVIHRTRFAPPTHEEALDYCCTQKYDIDIDSWMAYYQANGWKVGKNQMKDWKAAIRHWWVKAGKPMKQATVEFDQFSTAFPAGASPWNHTK